MFLKYSNSCFGKKVVGVKGAVSKNRRNGSVKERNIHYNRRSYLLPKLEADDAYLGPPPPPPRWENNLHLYLLSVVFAVQKSRKRDFKSYQYPLQDGKSGSATLIKRK
ncbi:hypothetical protein [Rufibacter quisquiliarum]|uniref:Uncharacterized protein n=1 Tax=Rufibacter quisquiliarum TaxID=1549639 RepID=A0A839GYP7_9BACT|nr:hypothetical protein [Rufibacter quisquiliarum]MBA9078781.1 hypothetical protein [Rufibacter quisquiliarum]